MPTRRPIVVVALAVALVLAGSVAAAIIVSLGPHTPALTPAQLAAQAAARRARLELAAETKAANSATRLVAVTLPDREGAPAPATPSTLFTTPLAPHEVVGFVPYWELGSVPTADVAGATELVYSSVCAGPNGGIAHSTTECANGLNALAGGAFTALVDAAHQSGDRVLLSVETTSDAVIESLDAMPATRAPKLADAVEALVRQYGLDGVNIDIEGTQAHDRAGFVRFVTDLTSRLRADDPHGTVLLDTYAASAASGASFFDVARLSRLVDALFIEAYGMDSPLAASANSPLKSHVLGYSVVQTLMQYEKVVPAAKLILGLPFYGNDFTVGSSTPGARATTSYPEAFSYFAIVATGDAVRWDPRTDTPFAEFKRDGKWHEIWFDDPVSIALKTAAASLFHTAGVGAWAFGMDANAPGMFASLSGGSPPVKLPLLASST